MNPLLASAATFLLLVAGAAAWLAALVVTRRSRHERERRVDLVAGAVQPGRAHGSAAHPSPAAPAAGRDGARRLFSLGAARRWGMQASAPTLSIIGAVAAVCAWLVVHNALRLTFWIAILVTAAAFVLAPRALLLRQQRRSEQRFMVLFPDAIDMIIRMVRAGLPVTAATRAVANEAPAPVKDVFQSITDQVDIGIPFEDALALSGERIGLPDFRFFSVAVSLQRATGGNLAVTLEILAEIIRKRRTVRLQAQATTGEIRMSAYILGAVPFFVTGSLLVISPGYLAPLVSDPRGHVIIGMAALGLALAFLSMRRMLHSVTMT